MPSTGAGATFQPAFPQPITFPYATGSPKEGPQSFLAFVNIAAGSLTGNLSLDISQFGMSMCQSILVDNEANGVGIAIKSRNGVNFGIQAFGTQIIPIFQQGTQLSLAVTLASVQAGNTQIAFQIFNYWVPPASWVSNLAVSGNVNVASVSGSVIVNVSNANLLGMNIGAAKTGGCTPFFTATLTNTVVQVKAASGQATFKGFMGMSAAVGWLQIFDAPNPAAVTLGTTAPTASFPVQPISTPQTADLPPEGMAVAAGLMAAWTTTANGAAAPASAFQGTLFYF